MGCHFHFILQAAHAGGIRGHALLLVLPGPGASCSRIYILLHDSPPNNCTLPWTDLCLVIRVVEYDCMRNNTEEKSTSGKRHDGGRARRIYSSLQQYEMP